MVAALTNLPAIDSPQLSSSVESKGLGMLNIPNRKRRSDLFLRNVHVHNVFKAFATSSSRVLRC